MKRLILFIFILFPFIFLISCGSKKDSVQKHYIISVHDGDTFTDEEHTIYRLYGVDTAEISNQFNDFHTTLGIEQIYAYEAMEFVKNRINNRNVTVLKIATDKYNRTVARIIYDKKDLSIELIKAGLARMAYINTIKDSPYETNDFNYYEKLMRAQKEAHDKKKGFWKHENDFDIIFPKAI